MLFKNITVLLFLFSGLPLCAAAKASDKENCAHVQSKTAHSQLLAGRSPLKEVFVAQRSPWILRSSKGAQAAAAAKAAIAIVTPEQKPKAALPPVSPLALPPVAARPVSSAQVITQQLLLSPQKQLMYAQELQNDEDEAVQQELQKLGVQHFDLLFDHQNTRQASPTGFDYFSTPYGAELAAGRSCGIKNENTEVTHEFLFDDCSDYEDAENFNDHMLLARMRFLYAFLERNQPLQELDKWSVKVDGVDVKAEKRDQPGFSHKLCFLHGQDRYRMYALKDGSTLRIHLDLYSRGYMYVLEVEKRGMQANFEFIKAAINNNDLLPSELHLITFPVGAQVDDAFNLPEPTDEEIAEYRAKQEAQKRIGLAELTALYDDGDVNDESSDG